MKNIVHVVTVSSVLAIAGLLSHGLAAQTERQQQQRDQQQQQQQQRDQQQRAQQQHQQGDDTRRTEAWRRLETTREQCEALEGVQRQQCLDEAQEQYDRETRRIGNERRDTDPTSRR